MTLLNLELVIDHSSDVWSVTTQPRSHHHGLNCLHGDLVKQMEEKNIKILGTILIQIVFSNLLS